MTKNVIYLIVRSILNSNLNTLQRNRSLMLSKYIIGFDLVSLSFFLITTPISISAATDFGYIEGIHITVVGLLDFLHEFHSLSARVEA